MMEEQLNPLAVTHLLQYTLRSLCSQDNSQWVYAVFWRILPRNYPPPKWDSHGGAYDRSRGNRRNWILVWEDGFCNFAASSSSSTAEMSSGEYPTSSASPSASYANCTEFQPFQGLQPELFFKMSHEIYNYGEGLIGKVAADHSHKWIYKEPNENQEINFLSAWHNSADAQPRTWEAQFQSGIKTIALIAVREGVVQLGAVHKVVEDLSYVVLLRKKFAYIESIPGVLLPHPSSAAFPTCNGGGYGGMPPEMWAGYPGGPMAIGPTGQLLDHHQHQYGYDLSPAQPHQPMVRMITPSMSSLEALLSKLPNVVPCPAHHASNPNHLELMGSSVAQIRVAKEEMDHHHHHHDEREGVECCSNSMSSYNHHHQQSTNFTNYHHHQDLNLAASRPGTGF